MKQVTIVWINRDQTKVIITTPVEILNETTIFSHEPDLPPIGVTPEFKKSQARAKQDYFNSVIAWLGESKEIVLFGTDNTKEKFLDYLNQIEPMFFAKVIGVESALDIPEEKIIARARKYI